MFFVAFLFYICEVSATSTKLYVDPIGIINRGLNVGSTFWVNINISDVSDLAGFELKLYWDPNILTYNNDNIFVSNIWSDYYTWKRESNVAEGYYYIGFTKRSSSSSFSGNGSLAQIEFKIKNNGMSILDLKETKLGNSNALPIIHALKDGVFSTYPCNSDRTLNDGKCHEACGASQSCDMIRPNNRWCDLYVSKFCSITCSFSQIDCKIYGSSFYCSNGGCMSATSTIYPGPNRGGGGRMPLMMSLSYTNILMILIVLILIGIIIFGILRFSNKNNKVDVNKQAKIL